MADVNARIGIDIDASDALAQLKALQRQLSQFHTSIARSSDAAAAAQRSMQKNLIDSVNSLGGFSAELRTVRTTAESFTNSLEKNKFSMREYFRYAAASTKTFGSVFRSEFDTIGKVAEDRVKRLQTQYIKMGRDANGAMRAIAIIPDSLNLDDNATKLQLAAQRQQLFNQLVKQGSTNLLNFGKNTQWAGRQLMVGFTIPLMTLGSVASRTFMEMETAALKFRKVYGDLFTPKAETQAALDGITELGRAYTKYGISVAQTVGLAAEAAAAGFQGADLQRQTEQATRLSILGQVDQQKALETTISLQNSFRMSSEELADAINFLNAVENQTVTSLDDVTTAIPKAAPVIQQLGGDVRDLAFLLTAMREGGINASEGANALKSGLASIINPTAKASDMLATMGINIDKIVESNRGNLRATVVEFATAMNQLDPLSRARAIEQLFGKFQFARISTLLQNVTQTGNQADRVLSLASSSVQELADLSAQELGMTAESAMNKFKGAVEDLRFALIPLGETFLTVLTPIVEMISGLLDRFNNLSDGTKRIIAGITLVLGGIGPIALMAFGLLANGLANIIKLGLNLRNAFLKLTGQSRYLGETTQYLTSEQLEASAAAASLDQAHANLTQRFTIEASAVDKLREAYLRAINASNQFAMANPGMMIPGRIPKFARGGIIKGPGTGTSDSIVAKVSNGEAIIPADSVARNPEIVNALIAGNIPGFAGGRNGDTLSRSLSIGNRQVDVSSVGQREFAVIQRRLQNIDNLAESELNSLADIIERFVSSVDRKANELDSMLKESESQNIRSLARGRVATGTPGMAAAHLTSRRDISSKGLEWLESQPGRGEGGKSITAQNILSVARDPELSQFVREYSGLTASLSQSLNNQLKTGAAVSDFNEEWSAEGSRLLPSLREFGGFVSENSDDLQALSRFESELGQKINSRSDVIETGIVTDRILEEETRILIDQYKNSSTAIGKVARAADAAANAIGQVSIAMSESQAEQLVAEGRARRVETDREIRYLSDSGAVLGRKSRESGAWRPERFGRLAKDEGIASMQGFVEGAESVASEGTDIYTIARSNLRNSPHPQARKDGSDDGAAYERGFEGATSQSGSAFPPRGRRATRPQGPSQYETIPGFGTSVRIPEGTRTLPLVSERTLSENEIKRIHAETVALSKEAGRFRQAIAGFSPNMTNVSFGLSSLSGMLMMATGNSQSAFAKFNDALFKASTALMAFSMVNNMVPGGIAGRVLGRARSARQAAAFASYGASAGIGGIAGRVAGAGSNLPGVLGKVVPLFGRLTVLVSKFLGPWGMAIAGVSAAVGIWKAVNAAKERERMATEGLADAMTITTEKAKNLGEFFNIVPQLLPSQTTKVGIGTPEQRSQRQQILESEFFQKDYVQTGQVAAIRSATASQAKAIFTSITTMMRGQGFDDAMIQTFIDALKSASGKTKLTFNVENINFENVETTLTSSLNKVKKLITDGVIGKPLEKELKTAGRYIANTLAGLAGQLNTGKITGDQFRSVMNLVNVEFNKLDTTSRQIMVTQMFTNIDEGSRTAIKGVKDLNRQMLLLQAASLGMDITEFVTGNKASNKTISDAMDAYIKGMEKVGKAIAAATGTTPTPTGGPGDGELSAMQKAVIARYEKEAKALQKKRDALKEVNDELDRQYEFEKKQQELSKSMVEAKISGDYIGAALLGQQKLMEKTKFDRETAQIELDKRIAKLEARIAEIQAGGRVTAAEAALAGKIIPTTSTTSAGAGSANGDKSGKSGNKKQKTPSAADFRKAEMSAGKIVPAPVTDATGSTTQFFDTKTGKWVNIKLSEYAKDRKRYITLREYKPGMKYANGGLIKVKKYSMGGLIKGPGTSKSDSILGFSAGGPIGLSNNEYVVQAQAVRTNGLDYMNALNSGRITPGVSSNESSTVYNNITMTVSGVQDPERAADLVIKKLQVASNKTNRTNNVSNNRRAI